MQEIKEIIQLFRQANQMPGVYQSVDDSTAMGSQMTHLLQIIEKKGLQTDEEAGKILFPEDKDGAKYRKVKAELKSRLYEAVMNLNTNLSRYTEYQRAYYQSHKQWLVVKVLTGMNANTAAVSLANKLLKQAEKYDFTLLCMDITSYLQIQYGVREGNEKKHQWASSQAIRFFELYKAELMAERYYTELTIQLVNNHAAKLHVHQLAVGYSEEVGEQMATKTSYKLQMYGYLIGLIRYSTVNDYEGALQFSTQAVNFFKTMSFEAKVPLQIFNYQILVCNIQLRRFEEGEKVARECLALFVEGTFNWFKYQDLYFLLMLHTGEYEKAAALLEDILHHPKFEFLPDNMKELWRLYEAYIHYLSLFHLVAPAHTKKFKLSRFISDTSILTKDKSGRNVAIIVIRFLILLKEEKFSILLDELESINQYCYNYLRGEQTKRSFSLIKMLLVIPLGQYDPERIAPKVEKHKKVLEESPFDINNQTYEIEVMPYEVLWDMAMQGLNERKAGLKSGR